MGAVFEKDRAFFWIRAKRLARLSVGQIGTDLAAALSAPRLIFQTLAALFFFYLIFLWFGAPRMVAEVSLWATNVLAVVLAAAFMLVVVVITAPFRALKAEAKRGQWFGPRFVYHQPRHVFTTIWSPRDNGKMVKFRADDVEPNSFVNCRIDVDGGGDRVEVTIGHTAPWTLPIFVGGHGDKKVRPRYTGRTTGSRSDHYGNLVLQAESLPGTVTSTIRVHVLSFEVGRGDYFDSPDPAHPSPEQL